jgi:nucleoside-diphosphate-sugar epimerase
MNGEDIDGLTEDQLPSLPMPFYLQEYASSKALGEMACTKANCDKLLTCAIAPHQVYGPRDNLFLPNVLEAAGSGKLRIFAKSST